MTNFLKINPEDSVAVALAFLAAGTVIRAAEYSVTLLEDIPQGHKFSLTAIAAGSPVIKYGSPIGIAVQDIPAGCRVHTHNMKTGLNDQLSYTWSGAAAPLTVQSPRTFNGYRRKCGRAGVRNEIWIIPTVGCVNNAAAAIARKSQNLLCGSIDAILSFSHPYGCSQMGEDQENTRRILADLIMHPNAGGILVLGLGCENSGVDVLKSYLGPYEEDRVKFLVCQDCEDEIAAGIRLVGQLCETAGADRRQAVSTRQLIVGLKCGGSDGLSGITANPVVGAFSDLFLRTGGTTILTEVPEMFGAETLLMNRCESRELFDRTVNLINDFKSYFTSHGQTVYENPSPGNKKGGISTLEDKSLGCVQKSGSAPVSGVLSYGEAVSHRGLNLLSAPGNDLVASTALAASGAQIVLFTTGRGTPFASPVPTVKISSNSALAVKKRNWIDFDCGALLNNTALPELARLLFDYVLAVAGGEKVKSEEAGYHDMAIFKNGVTL